MTKSKNTKRALLMSILSMMLCIAMLAGSTFAWFTDTVTSGKNRIVAGNLDVELEYKTGNMTGYKNVNAADVPESPFFRSKDGDPIKWEPGVMAYTYFKVANVGTLALKYQLSTILDTTDESLSLGYNTVKGKDGSDITVENSEEPASLLNALYVKVIDGDADLTERPTYTAANGVLLKDYLEGGSTTASALEPGASTTSTVVIYWPESEKDNTWNLQNGKHASDATTDDPVGALKVLLDVKLIATQYPSEADSFDNQYDADAKVDDDNQITVSSVRGTAKTVAKEETVITVGSVGNTATSTKVTVSADAIEAGKDVTLVVEESEDSEAVATITAEQGTPLYFDVSLEDETGAAVALAENGCVDIEMDIGKNLEIKAVNHRTSALDTDTSKSEYYSYDLNTGILKLHVTSLSPFSVGYIKAAAKVDDVFYTSLNDAIANAASGKTVTVLSDTTITTGISVSKNLTIDLNGCTVTAEPVGKNDYWGPTMTVFDVKAAGTLNLVDSSNANGTVKVDPAYTCTVNFASNYGTINLGNVIVDLALSTYKQTVDKTKYATTCDTNRATVRGISNYGTINLDGATLNASVSNLTLIGNYNIVNAENSTTNISNGATGFYGQYYGSKKARSQTTLKDVVINVSEEGTGVNVVAATAEITDVTINMAGTAKMSGSSAYGINVNKSASYSNIESEVAINGNTKITVNYTSLGARAIVVNAGKATIDENVSVTDNGNGYAILFSASALAGFENAAQLEIKNGTFTGAVQSNSGTGTMTISGGTFNGTLVATGKDRVASINVIGGSFSVNPSAVTYLGNTHNYVADGYKAVLTDGMYVVSAVE